LARSINPVPNAQKDVVWIHLSHPTSVNHDVFCALRNKVNHPIDIAKNNHLTRRLESSTRSSPLWSKLRSLDLAKNKFLHLPLNISLDNLNLFFTIAYLSFSCLFSSSQLSPTSSSSPAIIPAIIFPPQYLTPLPIISPTPVVLHKALIKCTSTTSIIIS